MTEGFKNCQNFKTHHEKASFVSSRERFQKTDVLTDFSGLDQIDSAESASVSALSQTLSHHQKQGETKVTFFKQMKNSEQASDYSQEPKVEKINSELSNRMMSN